MGALNLGAIDLGKYLKPGISAPFTSKPAPTAPVTAPTNTPAPAYLPPAAGSTSTKNGGATAAPASPVAPFTSGTNSWNKPGGVGAQPGFLPPLTTAARASTQDPKTGAMPLVQPVSLAGAPTASPVVTPAAPVKPVTVAPGPTASPVQAPVAPVDKNLLNKGLASQPTAAPGANPFKAGGGPLDAKLPAAMSGADASAARVKETANKPSPAPTEINATATGTAAPSEWQTLHDNLTSTVQGYLSGQPDTAYRAALNQLITSSGLMNQAERDQMQMQINQDPALKGQGAGLAMMSILARNQNLNLDEAIGNLSVQSLNKLIDLQKYGLQVGTQMEAAHIDNQRKDFQTLIDNGQFDGAASTLQSMLDSRYPGLNLHVDAASLKSRDPFTLTQMTQKVDFLKGLSGSKPTAALAVATSMMNDPAWADYFPKGMTPDQLVASLASGQVPQNIQASQTLQTEINTLAAAGKGFDATGSEYDTLFNLTGRDAVAEGRKLSLEDINALREGDKLPPFTQDSTGQIVDEHGIPLTNDDFKHLAYESDYAARVKTAATKPWESERDAILASPLGKYFTDEKLYPGGNDVLTKFLMAQNFGADLFIKDPQTGEMTVDPAKLQLSLNSPEMWPIFHNWPSGAFDAQGNLAKDANGNPAFLPGGYVYGDIGPDGKPVMSTPDDQKLDSAYFAYRNSGGTLKPTEWFFATAGGVSGKPDETKIPDSVKTTTPTSADDKITKDTTDRLDPIKKDAFTNDFKNTYTADELAKKMADPAFQKQAVGFGLVKNFNNAAEVPLNNDDWDAIARDSNGYFSVNGRALKILPVDPGGDDHTFVDGNNLRKTDRVLGKGSAVMVTVIDPATGLRGEMIVKGSLGSHGIGTVVFKENADHSPNLTNPTIYDIPKGA